MAMPDSAGATPSVTDGFCDSGFVADSVGASVSEVAGAVGSVRVPAFSDGAALVDSLCSGVGAWFVSAEFAGDVVSAAGLAAAGVVLSGEGALCVSLGSACAAGCVPSDC
ncbi:hypothetical protein AW168_25765 [Nocardia brasiliensis]|nr:hypothetical protein AW168_25765 [Nocardia brasiliensis]